MDKIDVIYIHMQIYVYIVWVVDSINIGSRYYYEYLACSNTMYKKSYYFTTLSLQLLRRICV